MHSVDDVHGLEVAGFPLVDMEYLSGVLWFETIGRMRERGRGVARCMNVQYRLA